MLKQGGMQEGIKLIKGGLVQEGPTPSEPPTMPYALHTACATWRPKPKPLPYTLSLPLHPKPRTMP